MNLLAAVTAALLIAPGHASAASSGSHPLWSRLHDVCAGLRARGWKAPTDGGLDARAEMNVPGVVYMCTLAQPLAGVGPGRAPQLQVLLSGTDDVTSAIFSANVWCARDVEPALQSLAAEVGRVLETVGVTPPAEALTAIRAGRAAEAHGPPAITYSVVPIPVDQDACRHVAPGGFGPVYMKVDVALKPTR
jgi:hypothetical protein